MKITLILILFIGFFMEKADAEPIFQTNSPPMRSIDGSAMKALKIAGDEFVESGKDMREFNITFSEKTAKNNSEADDVFIVTFMGKLSLGKTGLGTANRVPGSVT